MSQPKQPSGKRPRRLWCQYSLRTLLGLVTLAVGLLVAWRAYVEPYHRQRQTMKLIEHLGGTYQTTEAPKWLRRLYGDDFQNITLVNLAECHRPDEYIAGIAALPAVETLVVGGLEFEDRHLQQLAARPALRRLVLDSTAVSDEALSQWQARSSQVAVYQSQRQALAAMKNRLFGATIGNAQSQPRMAEFRQVLDRAFFDEALTDSVRNGWGVGAVARNDRELAWLRCLKNAPPRLLDCRRSDVTDEGLRNVAGFDRLTILYLSRTPIGDDGTSYLARLKELRALHLDETKVTDIGLANIAALTHLAELWLGSTKVSGAGLKSLARLSQLRDLRVDDTAVDDEGLVHLAGLPLVVLDVSATRVSDRGLAEIGKLHELQTLRLSGTRISDAGLRHLYQLKSLSTLELTRTPVSHDALEALQAALPDCHNGGP